MSQTEERQTAVTKDDAAVAATTSNTDTKMMSTPPYLKLLIDCWEHIFDYLSFKDIYVMGETCKQMHQFAGYYIRQYYPELEYSLIKDEIHFAHPHNFIIKPDFYKFISKLHIKNNTGLDYFTRAEKFDSLKMLIIGQRQLNDIEIEHMRNILQNIETIQLVHCHFAGNVFERLGNWCSKLKFLHIHNCTVTDNVDFFLQYFPTLEHLQYRPLVTQKRIDQLKIFLEKHSNLKQFAACYHFLWANRDLLMQTDKQLDLLNVHFDSKDQMPFDQFVNLLKVLHGRGFYKALKLTFRFCRPANVDNDTLKNIIATLPSLQKLTIPDESFIDINRLTNIKEMYIEFLRSDNMRLDAETLAKSLPKLERLGLGSGFMTIDGVLPFVRYSTKLKSIVCPHFADNSFDLFALNRERKKLVDACEIVIFLPEFFYMCQKWNSQFVNSNLVKIGRFELNYDFYYNF